MRVVPVIASLACALAAIPAHAQARRLVYDPRWPYHHAVATRAEKALIFREVTRIADREFSDDTHCVGSWKNVGDANVLDVAQGAFTRPGARQRAILYQWCRPATVIAAEGVVVIEHGRIVAHAVTGDWPNDLRRVPDVDRDGRDELVMSAGQTEQGESWTWVTVLSLPPGRAVTRTYTAGADECGTLKDRPMQNVWPLYVIPGRRPRWAARHWRGACDHPRWRLRGGWGRPEPASGGFDRVR